MQVQRWDEVEHVPFGQGVDLPGQGQAFLTVVFDAAKSPDVRLLHVDAGAGLRIERRGRLWDVPRTRRQVRGWLNGVFLFRRWKRFQ